MQTLRNLFGTEQREQRDQISSDDHKEIKMDAYKQNPSSPPKIKEKEFASDKQLQYLKETLTETKNLAKQMEKCFLDVAEVVMKQDKIIRNGEESLIDAAKNMKRSRDLAKKVIKRKVKAMKRDCYFTMFVALAILWGFGICFGYLWSLNDKK